MTDNLSFVVLSAERSFPCNFTDQLEENMTWLNQALHVDKNFDVVYRVLTIADKKSLPVILLMVLQKMTLS